MAVRRVREARDIEHVERRVRQRFTEDTLRLFLKRRFQLFVGAVRRQEREIDSHPAQRDVEEVERAAVDGGGGDHMVSRRAEIEHGKEVRRLPRGGQHSRDAAFQVGDLRRDGVVRRVGKAGIEIAAVFEIEHLAHGVAALVFEGRTLYDGDGDGFLVARRVAGMDTFGCDFVIGHVVAPFPK